METARKFKCGCNIPKKCPKHARGPEETITINEAAKRYSLPAATIRTAIDRKLLTRIGLPISLYVKEIEKLIENKKIGRGVAARRMKNIKARIEK